MDDLAVVGLDPGHEGGGDGRRGANQADRGVEGVNGRVVCGLVAEDLGLGDVDGVRGRVGDDQLGDVQRGVVDVVLGDARVSHIHPESVSLPIYMYIICQDYLHRKRNHKHNHNQHQQMKPPPFLVMSPDTTAKAAFCGNRGIRLDGGLCRLRFCFICHGCVVLSLYILMSLVERDWNRFNLVFYFF